MSGISTDYEQGQAHFVVCCRRQQSERRWEQYYVQELRGATLGVVGYGDIGAACARMARAQGMNVVALRRRAELSSAEQAEGVLVRRALWTQDASFAVHSFCTSLISGWAG
jgi:phosphoglycerate dehydrogenase-like enzyme